MNKYFTEKERYQLEGYYNQLHMKPREIANLMNKHVNTIYNELKRGRVEQIDTNLKKYNTYCADVAQRIYKYNATSKGRQLKIANDFQFAEYVEKKVKTEKYSLYAVWECSKGQFKTNICLRTLYNYYYHKVLNIKPSDMPYNKRKRMSYKLPKRIYQFGKCSIENRPQSVENRKDFGHWEMDTVVSSKKHKPCLLVLSERKTRHELLFKLENKKCSSVWTCLEKVASILGLNFKKIFKTITCDNGVEFSTNYAFKNGILKKFVQTNLYYCHPYCSCERGTNENQNKLIRRIVPKGSNIGLLKGDDVRRIQKFLNSYPRKLFCGLSSNDVLKQEGTEIYKLVQKIE